MRGACGSVVNIIIVMMMMMVIIIVDAGGGGVGSRSSVTDILIFKLHIRISVIDNIGSQCVV